MSELELSREDLLSMLKAENTEVDTWILEGLVDLYLSGKLQDLIDEDDEVDPKKELAKKFGILDIKASDTKGN